MKYVKISQPRLRDTTERPRLHRWLDTARQAARVSWIAGPPGAGKTTLAASYLMQSGAPASCWITLDAGDSDAATLFFFLSQALGDTHSLPRYTPERDPDVTVFARRFFRAFFAALPPGSLVVLDDLHTLDWRRAGPVIEAAFGEITPDVHVLALSRQAVPARLARLQMNGALGVLDWETLRFDDSEAAVLLGLPAASPLPASAAAMEGWAAGLLMLSAGGQSLPMEQREGLWRYFAGEVLDPLPAETRRCLLAFALVPALALDDAVRLCGTPQAGHLLRELYQDRRFVLRETGSGELLRLHAPLREFLVYQASLELPMPDLQALRLAGASLLEARGDLDAAATLHLAAQASDAFAAFLKRHAPSLLYTGHGKALCDWLQNLPAADADDAGLLYWRARAHVDEAPAEALTLLRRAEESFAAQGDMVGRLRAIAAIVDCYYHGLPDLGGLQAWAGALADGLRGLAANMLDANTAALLHARLALATSLLAPDAPDLPDLLTQAVQSLARADLPAERLAAGALILHGMDWLDTDTIHWLLSELETLAAAPGVDPLLRCRWYARKALCLLYLDGDLDGAQAANETGLGIAAAHRVARLFFPLKYNQAIICTALGETTAAASLARELRELVSPSRRLEHLRLASLETCVLLQQGDIAEAMEGLASFIVQAAAAGLPAGESARIDRFVACCHAQAGRHEDADRWFRQALERPGNQEQENARISRELVQVLALAQNGQRSAALPRLQAALSAHRLERRGAFLVRFPQLAAAVAELALDADIEREHVLGIIRRQHLRAPSRFSANWPWPVAVRTLGSMTVALHGEALAFSGKAQQRPLVLLKALLLAPPTGQPQQQVADHLWPDVSDARASLNVTIHRLRKLLGNDDAVLVSGGRLSINRAIVWSDLDALADLCERITHLPPGTDALELTRLAHALMGLYRGPFADGSDEPWLLAGRNRWRSRFLEAATALGQRLEQVGELAPARSLYLSALEAEPLAEELYRNLMRCAHAMNDPAAAFSAFRRCRETLSVILGKRPSAETEKLAVSIGLIEDPARR